MGAVSYLRHEIKVSLGNRWGGGAGAWVMMIKICMSIYLIWTVGKGDPIYSNHVIRTLASDTLSVMVIRPLIKINVEG